MGSHDETNHTQSYYGAVESQRSRAYRCVPVNRLIDDFGRAEQSALGTRWQAVSDRVMGGVSKAHMRHCEHLERHCIELSGDVSLENNGGFIQLALDLDAHGEPLDAREFQGLRMLVSGNGERYGVHLRTTQLERPWQSFRAEFDARESWHCVTLPFAEFVPHRVDEQLDTSKLRRLGFVAIGRAFHACLRIGRVEFYT